MSHGTHWWCFGTVWYDSLLALSRTLVQDKPWVRSGLHTYIHTSSVFSDKCVQRIEPEFLMFCRVQGSVTALISFFYRRGKFAFFSTLSLHTYNMTETLLPYKCIHTYLSDPQLALAISLTHSWNVIYVLQHECHALSLITAPLRDLRSTRERYTKKLLGKHLMSMQI